MRYFLIISAIALLSFGASSSSSNSKQAYISATSPLEYNSLIKTSEEMYKTSQELLNKVKHLP